MTLDYTKFGQIIHTITPFREKKTVKLCVINVLMFSLGGGTLFYFTFFKFKYCYLNLYPIKIYIYVI